MQLTQSYQEVEMFEMYQYLDTMSGSDWHKLMKIADKLSRKAIFNDVSLVAKSLMILKMVLSEKSSEYVTFGHGNQYAT